MATTMRCRYSTCWSSGHDTLHGGGFELGVQGRQHQADRPVAAEAFEVGFQAVDLVGS